MNRRAFLGGVGVVGAATLVALCLGRDMRPSTVDAGDTALEPQPALSAEPVAAVLDGDGPEPQQSRRDAGDSCEAGDLQACGIHAMLARRDGVRGPRNQRRAIAVLSGACSRGHSSSCVELARIRRAKPPPRPIDR